MNVLQHERVVVFQVRELIFTMSTSRGEQETSPEEELVAAALLVLRGELRLDFDDASVSDVARLPHATRARWAAVRADIAAGKWKRKAATWQNSKTWTLRRVELSPAEDHAKSGEVLSRRQVARSVREAQVQLGQRVWLRAPSFAHKVGCQPEPISCVVHVRRCRNAYTRLRRLFIRAARNVPAVYGITPYGLPPVDFAVRVRDAMLNKRNYMPHVPSGAAVAEVQHLEKLERTTVVDADGDRRLAAPQEPRGTF